MNDSSPVDPPANSPGPPTGENDTPPANSPGPATEPDGYEAYHESAATEVGGPKKVGSSRVAPQDIAREAGRESISTDPDTDPRKRAVALEAYLLWLKPMSYSQIARKLGMDRQTVTNYVNAEGKRRAGELGAARDAKIDQATSVYERVRDDALARMNSGQAQGDEWRAIVASQERLDKLHALEAPVPKDSLEASPLSALSPVMIVALLADVAARKAAALK